MVKRLLAHTCALTLILLVTSSSGDVSYHTDKNVNTHTSIYKIGMHPFSISSTLFQTPGTQDQWVPENPLELKGKIPPVNEIQEAIAKGVSYLISQQYENGAWDVVVPTGMIAQTVDQALDAVITTAVCGIALRTNSYVHPEEINKACDLAVNYIMDRIEAGKLSTNVFYASWRYSWSLHFLSLEYARENQTQEQKDRIRRIAQICVDALEKMQLKVRDESDQSASKQRRRELKGLTKPGSLSLEIDESASGEGVLISSVSKGKAADKAKLRPGDRIIEMNKESISNPEQYLDKLTSITASTNVKMKIRREDKILSKTVKPDIVWPGTFGFVLTEGGSTEGVILKRTKLNSPAFKKKMKEGDLIVKIDDKDIHNMDDYSQAISTLKTGQLITVKYRRGKSLKSSRMKCIPRLHGSLGITIQEEDQSAYHGVIINTVNPNSAAQKAGFRIDDRIVGIDDIRIKGYDDYYEKEKLFYEGQETTVTFIRSGSTNEEQVKVSLDTLYPPFYGSLGVELNQSVQDKCIVHKITKGKDVSIAGLIGLKKGDIITSLNNEPISSPISLLRTLQLTREGMSVPLHIKRGKNYHQYTVELGRGQSITAETTEHGGWNYYPMGLGAAHTTAYVILTLDMAKKTIGLKIPKSMIKEGCKNLESLRVHNNGYDGYAYSVNNLGSSFGEDIRGNIGRIMIIELALYKGKERSKSQMTKSMRGFMEFRHELDKVRQYPMTHYPQLYNNAAYYYRFGHLFAAAANSFISGSKLKKDVNKTILKVLMMTRESDGLWFGHPGFGKTTGTALSLMTFGELKGKYKENFPDFTAPQRLAGGPGNEGLGYK